MLRNSKLGVSGVRVLSALSASLVLGELAGGMTDLERLLGEVLKR